MPPMQELFGQIHPLMYPRNRFGKGYVLDHRRELIEGRELPNLERPGDELTPERLVVADLLHWMNQPIPIGFDYFDPLSFPRMGMLACPPLGYVPGERVPEAELGLVPEDFCRGNIMTARPEDYPTLLHPRMGECGSLGLNVDFLQDNEYIRLSGMDHDRPQLVLELPRERASFTIGGIDAQRITVIGEVYQATVDVDHRLLTLVWTGRVRPPRELSPDILPAIEEDVVVRYQRS
jgi:hypothetical protein